MFANVYFMLTIIEIIASTMKIDYTTERTHITSKEAVEIKFLLLLEGKDVVSMQSDAYLLV